MSSLMCDLPVEIWYDIFKRYSYVCDDNRLVIPAVCRKFREVHRTIMKYLDVRVNICDPGVPQQYGYSTSDISLLHTSTDRGLYMCIYICLTLEANLDTYDMLYNVTRNKVTTYMSDNGYTGNVRYITNNIDNGLAINPRCSKLVYSLIKSTNATILHDQYPSIDITPLFTIVNNFNYDIYRLRQGRYRHDSFMEALSYYQPIPYKLNANPTVMFYNKVDMPGYISKSEVLTYHRDQYKHIRIERYMWLIKRGFFDTLRSVIIVTRYKTERYKYHEVLSLLTEHINVKNICVYYIRCFETTRDEIIDICNSICSKSTDTYDEAIVRLIRNKPRLYIKSTYMGIRTILMDYLHNDLHLDIGMYDST